MLVAPTGHSLPSRPSSQRLPDVSIRRISRVPRLWLLPRKVSMPGDTVAPCHDAHRTPNIVNRRRGAPQRRFRAQDDRRAGVRRCSQNIHPWGKSLSRGRGGLARWLAVPSGWRDCTAGLSSRVPCLSCRRASGVKLQPDTQKSRVPSGTPWRRRRPMTSSRSPIFCAFVEMSAVRYGRSDHPALRGTTAARACRPCPGR